MGLETKVVSSRLNRRKIDLIPITAWADPKKTEIAHLAEEVTARLSAVGIADLAEVVALAADSARGAGLADPRITSDVKHVEIGLTDKSDSARFAADWLAERGITGALVLMGGDEFGPIGGVAGERLADVGGRPCWGHGRLGRYRARRRQPSGRAPGRWSGSLP